MDRCLLLISTLALVSCKPQYQINDGVDISQDTNPKVTLIPFYGGGKGQSLQLTEFSNGSVMTMIIKTPQPEQSEEEIVNAAELENPPLPTRQEFDGFNENLKNIHETALNIIKLQEIAKNGKLNQAQEESYQKNMDSLNFSAQNLARAQEETDYGLTFENREGLSEWFERKKANTNKKDKDNKKKEEEEKKKKEAEEEEKRKRQEEEKRKEEEEKKKKQKPKEEEEEEEEIVENEDDSITIGLPPDEASVAEAKPVGLAVAGEGGVAASKPIATAVVGPGGLAIARPVGTAIAGVSPDQALVPIYAEGYVVGASKPKRYGSTKKPDVASEYLNKIISKYHQN